MAGISKEEYLKRYLSPADGDQKLKKKRKKKPTQNLRKGTGMKIVDDDVGWDSIVPDQLDDINDKLLTLDEKPQIENIDDRTQEEKELDEYRRSKMWKKLDVKTSTGSHNKTRYDSDSDLDLQRNANSCSSRKSNRHSSSDSSESDLDLSRHKSKHIRHDSDSDFDIPRNKKQSEHVSHRTKAYNSDSDLEIPRKKSLKNASRTKTRHDSDSDLEIPRKKTKASDSHRRKSKASSSAHGRHDSDSDLDVQRKSDSTIHPGTNSKKQMETGGRSGLTSVDLLRLEMKKLEKQESNIKKLADEYKDTTTVYRERGTGKKRDLNKEENENDEEKLKRKKKEEMYDKWGKGLKQAEMRAESIADTLHESNKTLTRYADDEDLEAMRKEAIRDGDPMAEYIARKKSKEKGNKKEFPKYRGPAPAPNRFKMQPGYRWDGVDRSNGFEKKYFEHQSNNQAHKDEYYKWSVADM